MTDVRYKIGRIVIWPLESMQSIVAICMILFAFYLLSPFYVPSSEAVTYSPLLLNIAVRDIFYSAVFILPALSTVAGWFNTRFRTSEWRARGCFGMFVAAVFFTILRILAVGFFPPIWLFYLALGLVSAVCYLHWKVN